MRSTDDTREFARKLIEARNKINQKVLEEAVKCKIDREVGPKYFVESWRFHWKFWDPKQCVGGPVYFGWWASCAGQGRIVEMSWEQVIVKREGGILG